MRGIRTSEQYLPIQTNPPRHIHRHRLTVFQHIIIHITHHPKSLRPQVRLASSILIRPPNVRLAIDFDNQSMLEAHEVDHERSNRNLSSEFDPPEPPIAKYPPQRPLGPGHVTTKTPGAIPRCVRFIGIRNMHRPAAPSPCPLPPRERVRRKQNPPQSKARPLTPSPLAGEGWVRGDSRQRIFHSVACSACSSAGSSAGGAARANASA